MARSSTKATTSKTPVSPAKTVKALRSIRKTEVGRFTKVKNTDSSYQGHISRGRAFLNKLITRRRENGEGEVCSEGIQTGELERAFENPPNQHSATALELFLVQKCFTEGCGVSTADGIHGAFAALWDKMDGKHYAGPYSLNEHTGEIQGCPARAENVGAVVEAVKIRAKSKGASATRNHADAISLEELQKLMRWSMSTCPDSLLTASAARSITDLAELKFRLEHAFMRAFMSSAFTLWTRCFELLSLQASDIEEDCRGPAPYYISHFKVHLTNRKGWQKEKGYDGPRTSNVYDIYQQDISQIDMYTHMIRWRDFLEGYLGAKLQPDDFLFPHLSVNGVIRTARQMSYDGLQVLLSKFCDGAGLLKRYTTHSFRRGGAQYRFMHAPIGKRWSLNRIRWWGGWAVGEHVDTLIKYLVDSLQSFENGHGNALHPIPIESDKSFMGDHIAVNAVTGEEFRQFGNAVNQKLDDFITIATSAPKHDTSSDLSAVTQSPPDIASMSISAETQRSPPVTMSQACHCSGESCKSPPGLPFRRVSIPNLGRERGAWRRAVAQWEEVDPATGLALRDWPSTWYRGEQRLKLGSLRSQRLLVFEEYERLGRDDDRFREEYPDADRSMADLLTQIRKNKKVCRSRKNRRATPEYHSASLNTSHHGSEIGN